MDPLPFRGTVKEIDETAVARLADGRRVRLAGLRMPAEAVRPDDYAETLRDALRGRLQGREVWFYPEPNAPGDRVDATALVRLRPDAPSVNEQLLAEGRAVLGYRAPGGQAAALLQAASRTAQQNEAGWFGSMPKGRLRPGRPIPYLNGAVLGLHYQVPRQRYHHHLDELAEAGFDHVCLLLSVFVQDATSIEIDRATQRTATDERLVETVRYAKAKGMSVMLLPIVLLKDAGDDDWRGTLRPRDPGRFWLAYDAFLAHYLDLAEATDVDVFSVGSEFSSMESQTEAWRRIIGNARGRFRGLLTYSANWDHVHVPRFFGLLDLVGMTAYFSLSDQRDPDLETLQKGWRDTAIQLQRSVGMIGKPVVFTELGYPSQNGVNTDPWNYVMNQDDIDLQEQADCFEAFLREVPSMRFLRGAYFYDFFDEGGPKDYSYSPRGKPAMQQWRRWAAYRPSER